MKKAIRIFSCSLAVTFFCVSIVQAQLINYNRRQKIQKQKAATSTKAATATTPATAAAAAAKPTTVSGGRTPAVELASWLTTAPWVTNRDERRFDSNRDGKLQAAETKSFMEEVIKAVERRGGYTVNSEILKEYDDNQDGMISRYEVTDIKQDIQR